MTEHQRNLIKFYQDELEACEHRKNWYLVLSVFCGVIGLLLIVKEFI